MSQSPCRFLFVIGIAVIAWLGGCPPATDSTGGDTPAPGFLTTANRTILDKAKQAYTAAVADKGVDAARAELVGRLRATEGVAAAGLFEDGATIFIKHTNGQLSALVTRNFNPPAENPQTAKGITRAGATQPAGTHRTALATVQGASAKAVPQSRKVLMLNILYPLAPWSDTGLDRLEQNLVAAGWDGTDDKLIDRRTRVYIPPPPPAVTGEPNWKAIAGRSSTAGSADFTPDDLFNLGGYGAIVILTHGLYGDPAAAVAESSTTTGTYEPLPPPVTSSPTFKRIGSPAPATAQDSSAGGPYLYLMCGPNMDFGQDVGLSGETDPSGDWTYVPPAPPPVTGNPNWKRLAAKVSDERYAQYGQWFDEGKLIVASYTQSGWEGRQDLYVRADLLAEQMAQLESNSVVYLSAAYGWKAQSVFADHGAGDLFAWDGDANLWQSIAMGDASLGRMMGQNCASDVESYGQGTLPAPPPPVTGDASWKTLRSQGTDAGGAAGTFMLYTGANELYLPAWAEVTFSAAPQDAATLHLVLSYADAAVGIPAQEFDIPAPGSDPLEIKALIPAEMKLEFTALSASGQELDRGSRTVKLKPGQSSIKLTFVPEMYEIVFDPNAIEVHFDAGQWGVATVNAVLLAYETDESGNRIPIPDKEVKFSTTFGAINGADTATSGDDGTARVVIQSYNGGQARVTARVAEDGRQGDTYVNFAMNPIHGRTAGEVDRRPAESWLGTQVFVEWDKVVDGTGRGLQVETYWVTGSGFNDTAYYGDSYSEGINPGESGYSETETAVRVFLTGGGGTWDPTAPDQATDEELLQSSFARFAGAVWEIYPVFR